MFPLLHPHLFIHRSATFHTNDVTLGFAVHAVSSHVPARLHLVLMPDNGWRLLWNIHHIISADSYSLNTECGNLPKKNKDAFLKIATRYSVVGYRRREFIVMHSGVANQNLYSKLCITRIAGNQKKCSSYTEYRVRRWFFEWGNERKVWESCTSYAIIRVVTVKRSLLCTEIFIFTNTNGIWNEECKLNIVGNDRTCMSR